MSYYDEISEGYANLHGEEQERKSRLIERWIQKHHIKSVLDVGCGTGIFLSMLPENIRKMGLDPSERLLEKVEGEKVSGVAENLPFEDSSFDAVVSITAIHNFKDFNKGLEEMRRVSKEIVIVSVLKRSSKYKAIIAAIARLFEVVEKADDPHDTIFFCKSRKI